jgi:tetraprenyl-beta-curcumene synthase
VCPLTPRARPTKPCRLGGTYNGSDPSPLTRRQLWALGAAATRELTWGLPAAALEVRRWRRRAGAIPDALIRTDALRAIAEQRTHIDGAAAFSILSRARNPTLLRLLVAYEIIWDYLDNVNERSVSAGVANGLQLHRALVDALDPGSPVADYYRYSPWRGDGGYLRTLVMACRAHCERLPSYAAVRPLLVQEATRGQVCALNHAPDTPQCDAMLKGWAEREFPHGHEAQWFELTAAASTNLTVFAVLALASEPACPEDAITQTVRAYFPWISVLTAMLDSYVDQDEDAASGSHSYIAHYPTPKLAIERLCQLMRRCVAEAHALRDGEKHVVIAGCMFAMYLSRDSALAPPMRETTTRLVCAGGPLARILHPLLRLWRTAYGLRSA